VPHLPRIARVLGLTTYPLYLLHDITGAALLGLLVRHGIPDYVALVISLAFVFVVSALIAMLLEPVLQRWFVKQIDWVQARCSSLLLRPSRAAR